jgi:hypothetical protein
MRAWIAAYSRIYKLARQEQYERILRNEQLKNAIERIVLSRFRLRHRINARPKNKARASALVSVRQTLEKAAKLNAKNIKTVFNVSLYILLLDQDLAYFTGDLVLQLVIAGALSLRSTKHSCYMKPPKMSHSC